MFKEAEEHQGRGVFAGQAIAEVPRNWHIVVEGMLEQHWPQYKLLTRVW